MIFRKNKGEVDKVLRFAVVAVLVIFLIGAAYVGIKMKNPRMDATEGRAKLEKLEEANVQTIDIQIEELETAEKEAREAWSKKSYVERTEGCIFLGDITALSFQTNDLLTAARVAAAEGAMVSDTENSGLNGLVQNVLGAETKPKKLILSLGRADALSGNVTAESFSAKYQELLERLKAELPDTKIYVCSVPPARNAATETAESGTEQNGSSEAGADQTAAEGSEAGADQTAAEGGEAGTEQTAAGAGTMQKYPVIMDYNQALQRLCQTEGVTYIDSTSLIKAEYYGADEVTLSKDFYEACLKNILEAAFRRDVIS